MGEDKRSFPRSLVGLNAKIQIRYQWEKCKVMDLSPEGLSLESSQSLDVGELVKLELEHKEYMKKNQVQAEVIRCDRNPNETDPEIFQVVGRLIEPNDEYLMGALALVHGPGPKKDRRKPGFGER